jgi:hypothetical protein
VPLSSAPRLYRTVPDRLQRTEQTAPRGCTPLAVTAHPILHVGGRNGHACACAGYTVPVPIRSAVRHQHRRQLRCAGERARAGAAATGADVKSMPNAAPVAGMCDLQPLPVSLPRKPAHSAPARADPVQAARTTAKEVERGRLSEVVN